MESSDSFGQGVEIGEDDPFAGTDFGDFGDQPSENAGTTELKTVDREGNEVPAGGQPVSDQAQHPAVPSHAANDGASAESAAEGTKPAPEVSPVATDADFAAPAAEQPVQPSPAPASPPDNRTEEERAENARQYREAHGEGEYAPPPRGERAQQAEAVPSPEPVSAESERREQEGDVPVDDPTTPSAASTTTAGDDAIGGGAATEDPTPPTSPATEPSTTASATSSSEAEAPAASAQPQSGGSEEDAPEPEEVRDGSGKTTKRKYVVLQVVGPGKFEQVTWYEKDGGIVTKGTPGSKRQGIALVRGAEDALRLGYAALGSPTDTVHLVAVAQLHFQPKPVRPAAPKPSAVRLQIG